MRPRRPVPGRTWSVVAVAVLLATAALLWRDRGSVERANRLFRGGDAPAALDLYRSASERSGAGAGTDYNLGTALLALDADEAEMHLRSAIDGSDPAVAQRAYYNLGYHFLRRVSSSTPPDSARRLLTGAVGANRAALAFDPDHADARWNLDLARRALDSLDRVTPRFDDREAQRDAQDDLPIDETTLARTPPGDSTSGPPPPDAPDRRDPRPPGEERRGERVAVEGATEARIRGAAPPLSRGEALELIRNRDDDPEELIRGILWTGRPDVAWWSSEPYPGGDW